jgi:hypothetical protein
MYDTLKAYEIYEKQALQTVVYFSTSLEITLKGYLMPTYLYKGRSGEHFNFFRPAVPCRHTVVIPIFIGIQRA